MKLFGRKKRTAAARRDEASRGYDGDNFNEDGNKEVSELEDNAPFVSSADTQDASPSRSQGDRPGFPGGDSIKKRACGSPPS